ncbi:hypothetical protein C7N43_26835 [Sphingobacteriales bacterium UPWRP_1]|nr:hypothetical protein BVG80_14875 [Sphingobacteriales bacterium TSM_CSM]PSJ73902.1 hypothetical protein C7N43_26835 [Sphingobacteriales bacterium UPWRP_1]
MVLPYRLPCPVLFEHTANQRKTPLFYDKSNGKCAKTIPVYLVGLLHHANYLVWHTPATPFAMPANIQPENSV